MTQKKKFSKKEGGFPYINIGHRKYMMRMSYIYQKRKIKLKKKTKEKIFMN